MPREQGAVLCRAPLCCVNAKQVADHALHKLDALGCCLRRHTATSMPIRRPSMHMLSNTMRQMRTHSGCQKRPSRGAPARRADGPPRRAPALPRNQRGCGWRSGAPRGGGCARQCRVQTAPAVTERFSRMIPGIRDSAADVRADDLHVVQPHMDAEVGKRAQASRKQTRILH